MNSHWGSTVLLNSHACSLLSGLINSPSSPHIPSQTSAGGIWCMRSPQLNPRPVHLSSLHMHQMALACYDIFNQMNYQSSQKEAQPV